jgi:hypothetical protein
LNKGKSMTPAEQIRLTFRILSVSLALPFLLSTTKLPRLLEMMESRKKNVPLEAAKVPSMIRQVDKIARYRFFVIRNNCLKKSLLFYYFFLQAGVRNVRIHIGISKEDARLDGHSWLTLDGAVFLDSEDFVSKYTVIYTSGVEECEKQT